MNPFIIAAIVTAAIAQGAQAKAHPAQPGVYEQIGNRCVYIVAANTPDHAPEADITRAVMLCINGAERVITHGELVDASQRETLAADVEAATDQITANHAQMFLDAYDAGQLIGQGYAEPNGDDEVYDPQGHF